MYTHFTLKGEIMSTELSYDEYIKLAPVFAKRLIAILRKMPDEKTMVQLADEIGITNVTLMNFLKKPERPRKLSVLIKIEQYIERCEKSLQSSEN